MVGWTASRLRRCLRGRRGTRLSRAQKELPMLFERLEGRRLLSSYYVHPSGSDGSDGLTPETAWASTAKVNAFSFSAGDAVLFAGGSTFTGTVRFDAGDAGSPPAPITVGSYGGGRATIAAGNADGLSFFNT